MSTNMTRLAVKRTGANPAFALGAITVAPAVPAFLSRNNQRIEEFLALHQGYAWQAMAPEIRRENNRALKTGALIRSSFLVQQRRLELVTAAEGPDGIRPATCVFFSD